MVATLRARPAIPRSSLPTHLVSRGIARVTFEPSTFGPHWLNQQITDQEARLGHVGEPVAHEVPFGGSFRTLPRSGRAPPRAGGIARSQRIAATLTPGMGGSSGRACATSNRAQPAVHVTSVGESPCDGVESSRDAVAGAGSAGRVRDERRRDPLHDERHRAREHERRPDAGAPHHPKSSTSSGPFTTSPNSCIYTH